MSKHVVVGSIGAPYGVQGWVKINSFTEPKENLFGYSWLLENKDEWQPVNVELFREHGNGYVAKLAGIEDRDQAALITNKKIAVDRLELPELKDQHYWADLIGLKVLNHNDVVLGKVIEIFATGANDVLVVKGEKEEYLIPLVLDDYVLQVDLANKQMQVHWDI